jgi:peptidase E
MKLFLASSADKTLSLLEPLIPGVGKKVLFIANAADPYTDTYWVDWDRIKFKELGYELTELDLRIAKKEEFLNSLAKTDILHICGGSVSYLGWILRDKDVADAIIEAVENDSIIYTGTSAGSMIVSKDLAMFSYDDEEEKEYVEREFTKKGLGLISWTIAPHSDSKDFVESHKQVVEELVTNPTAVVLLHDKQAVWVETDSVRFLAA